MKKLLITFEKTGDTCVVAIDEAQSPSTVTALEKVLPTRIQFNIWGEELYSDPLPFNVAGENAQETVTLGAVAIWPPGSALCLFFGKTPVSEDNEIRPASPVNRIGQMESWPADLVNRVRKTRMAVVQMA